MASILRLCLSVMIDLEDRDAKRRREETDVYENNESQPQLGWPRCDLHFLGDLQPKEASYFWAMTISIQAHEEILASLQWYCRQNQESNYSRNSTLQACSYCRNDGLIPASPWCVDSATLFNPNPACLRLKAKPGKFLACWDNLVETKSNISREDPQQSQASASEDTGHPESFCLVKEPTSKALPYACNLLVDY